MPGREDHADRDVPFRLSRRADRTIEPPISYLLTQAVRNPGVISLAAGLVDSDTLPASESAEIVRGLLASDARARAALQYDTTAGLAEFRQTLLEHLAALDGLRPSDLSATADDVVVTTGSQQLLFLLTDVLVDPGDIVLTAWPTYFVYAGTLQSQGASVRGVEVDDDGILPSSLDSTLAELDAAGQLARVKIVYIVSYHDNPGGITLAAARRPEVLEIVRRYSRDHRILLIEDAAYRELTYEGAPPPSIKRYDAGNRQVALLQTFSKPFAPGFKTGYGLLPRDLVGPVVHQKGNHDFGSPCFCQHVLLEAMRSGAYARHAKLLRLRYAEKRDAMLQALRDHLGDFEPGRTHWTRPSGGLYVYLTLPEGMDTGREGALFARAVREGVLYVPGEYCYGADPRRTIPRNTMRLSFGVQTPEKIRAGIERLARAIRAVARETL